MFDSDYAIYGIHATYLKTLVNTVKAFERYIDVYMISAVLGVLNDRRSTPTASSDRARIYADAFNTERVKCNEIFKTVILCDTSKPWTIDERVNICFKYSVSDSSKDDEIASNYLSEAMELFNSYVLGGIEILHEIFDEKNISSKVDAMDYAFSAIYDFHCKIDSNVGFDENKLLNPEY